MVKKDYDFGGYATRNNLKCADGRTIQKDAFKDNDGQTVPLVWNHNHKDSDNVLGHAVLENREDGVYAYCYFNPNEKSQNAKRMIENGDVTSLSIFANKLKERSGNVYHGLIREVSLVLAGANPGAFIDTVLSHSEDGELEEEGYIISGENLELYHSDNSDGKDGEEDSNKCKTKKEDSEPTTKKENTEMENKDQAQNLDAKKVIEGMTEEQRTVLYALVGKALEDGGNFKHGDDDEEGEGTMKHNLFEGENDQEAIVHAEITEALADGKRYGSMKESFLEHGITDIEWLFPDAKNINGDGAPGFINTQPSGWVKDVMKGVHHTPFSRVKMQFADITMDEARAKGYLKGEYKKEEQIALLKRTINPQTVYKKQKLDRDDVVDITDFDVVSWLKGEMRMKLDEELARAFLFGDGRSASSDEKINESNIIPILKDTTNNLYAIEKTVTQGANESLEHAIIRTVVKSFDEYEGSGNTILFIKQGLVSDMLLMEDTIGHRLYKGIDDLANAMTVGRIVKVPASIVPSGFHGLVVDLADYNVGADKGGAINMFDDFDIDFNAQKYLIETRCSGGLTKPHSAIVLKASA